MLLSEGLIYVAMGLFLLWYLSFQVYQWRARVWHDGWESWHQQAVFFGIPVQQQEALAEAVILERIPYLSRRYNVVTRRRWREARRKAAQYR